MLIAQQIANLLNGVSQRPQEQRHSSQAEDQKNGLSSMARGLMKRPPMLHLGKLTATITGWTSAFVHSINRDSSERYHVVIANGDVQVFDAISAAPVSVIAPNGKAYLTDAAGAGYRAVTVGDTTMIVNRGTTVKRSTKKALAGTFRNPEALVYVRQADYATIYTVTLNGVPVSIKTVEANSPDTRGSISTDAIAGDLIVALKSEPLLSAFAYTQFGSTVHIVRTDSKDFTLSVTDGLADKGLKGIKGSVQSFADLPAKAPKGFVMEIAGEPETAKDNYWVEYTDSGTPGQSGVWRECPKPGTPVALDATTMPHRLTRKGQVVKETPHTGLPAVVATIAASVAAGVSTLIAWAVTTPGDVAIPAGTIPTVRDHGAGVKITSAVVGQWFRVSYKLDTSVVEPGVLTTVKIYKNGVEKGTAEYQAGITGNQIFLPPPMPGFPFRVWPQLTGRGQFFVNEALAIGNTIEVKLTYSTGANPTAYRRAFLTFLSVTPVEVLSQASKTIQFLEGPYPAGSQVQVTLDGVTTFTHTVGATDETAEQVGADLSTQINAHATYNVTLNTPTSLIQIVRANGLDFTVSVPTTFDPTKTFYNPALLLVPTAHVGRTIKNISDGSSATITANTVTTITASAGLAGGKDNKFSPGDICTVVGTGAYFVFEPCPWNERGAGDTEIVPFPSFTDKTISEVFFHANRLGFTSGENVVLSSAGDLFNFFRYTQTDLLDSDMIDVRSAHAVVSLFHSAVQWNEELYLLSENARFRLSGEPALTPRTVSLPLVDRYETSKGHRPAVAGTRLYASRGKSGFTEVLEYSVVNDSAGTTDADNIAQDSPKFIRGKPLGMVADSALGFLAVLADGDQRSLYVYSYKFDEARSQRLQASWSRWEFAPGTTIIGMDIVDRVLGLVTLQSDGAYISTIDLDVALDTVTIDEAAQYLDRRLTNLSTGVTVAYSAGPNTTTWTLPFNVATNGSEGTLVVVKRSPQVQLLTTTRPAANQIRVTGQGDLTAASVYIGLLYEFRYKFSRIYFRNRDGVPETRGRTILRYLDVLYNDTTDFSVVVSLDGRSPYTYLMASLLPAAGRTRVPVQSRNEYTTIELVNSSPGVCAFSGVDWEGDYSTRSKRV